MNTDQPPSAELASSCSLRERQATRELDRKWVVSGEKNPRRGRKETCLELLRERETPIRLNFIRGSFGLGVNEMHQQGGPR